MNSLKNSPGTLPKAAQALLASDLWLALTTSHTVENTLLSDSSDYPWSNTHKLSGTLTRLNLIDRVAYRVKCEVIFWVYLPSWARIRSQEGLSKMLENSKLERLEVGFQMILILRAIVWSIPSRRSKRRGFRIIIYLRENFERENYITSRSPLFSPWFFWFLLVSHYLFAS